MVEWPPGVFYELDDPQVKSVLQIDNISSTAYYDTNIRINFRFMVTSYSDDIYFIETVFLILIIRDLDNTLITEFQEDLPDAPKINESIVGSNYPIPIKDDWPANITLNAKIRFEIKLLEGENIDRSFPEKLFYQINISNDPLTIIESTASTDSFYNEDLSLIEIFGRTILLVALSLLMIAIYLWALKKPSHPDQKSKELTPKESARKKLEDRRKEIDEKEFL
ncbi:MAG: hypothetical protein HeimC2_41520 [Candidatus Heimdallarchaeota archaeon LC_2]|nr:MAG: hypothetical protein HeimC2_41520 [Candidatus Heimdallarchaeota archaeon LC_2]